MQIAIAQELPELPPFRQQENYTAYTEGWALYSERLGKEVGFFQDPYSYYGHLQDDMLRAIRLVVDTGFHYKHWSRQQVVDYFHDHSAIDEPEVQSETDRYMAWPAQALGYKIGQLEILKLRQYSKDQLGDEIRHARPSMTRCSAAGRCRSTFCPIASTMGWAAEDTSSNACRRQHQGQPGPRLRSLAEYHDRL